MEKRFGRVVLLAAHANQFNQRLLASAHSLCQRMDAGLEVLVLEVHDELPATLTDFVRELHMTSVVCKLTRMPQIRPRDIVKYANSHECIITVVVDTLESWQVSGTGKINNPWRQLVCPLVTIGPGQDGFNS